MFLISAACGFQAESIDVDANDERASQALSMSRSASAPHSALTSIVMLFASSARKSPSFDFTRAFPVCLPFFVCQEAQTLTAQIGRDAEALATSCLPAL